MYIFDTSYLAIFRIGIFLYLWENTKNIFVALRGSDTNFKGKALIPGRQWSDRQEAPHVILPPVTLLVWPSHSQANSIYFNVTVHVDLPLI